MSTFAYVVILWADDKGNCPYVEASIPFVKSLRANNPESYDIVLLHVNLHRDDLKTAETLFDVVKCIDHMTVHPTWLQDAWGAGRFDKVFTKLQCLLLTEYSKVILVDVDMIVLAPLSGAFDAETPAGCVEPGSPKVSFSQSTECENQYWDFTNQNETKYKLNSIVEPFNMLKPSPPSINAGFLLLQPSAQEYERIVVQLSNPITDDYKVFNDKKNCVTGPPLPEQYYLTVRYNGKWHYLPHFYNGSVARFQPNRAEQYKIIHFNGPGEIVPKPWTVASDSSELFGKTYFFCWSKYKAYTK